ncbi:DUF2218 domain-containing protein [Chitinilyticum aquatile]|uniref:DUF2218 domain-containing protein n=1 Tax=Chitinilyticum aquatile TaxID=362520 RepID=UPI0003FABEC3|nr:DUF2218 domain-containing protein [Chitinilyticum aquatile]
MVQSQTQINTELAKQYLFKLCKHFARKIPVDFDDSQGLARFPIGECRFLADSSTLQFRLSAPDPEQLQRLQRVLEEHLQLMRRAPDSALDWLPSDLPCSGDTAAPYN